MLPTDAIDPAASVIFWLTLVFLFGVLGRRIALFFHQPGVLGELLMGVFLGNLCYYFGMHLAVVLREGPAIFGIIAELLKGMSPQQAVNHTVSNPYYANQLIAVLQGPNGGDLLKVAYVVDIFSRYGVIFLLFMVGVESSVQEIRKAGRASLQVACIGVIAPLLLGLLVSLFFLPELTFNADLFIAATLSATSVGITARVLKELRVIKSREAQTILGAAMIDDVLGLILLAVVSSLVTSGQVELQTIGKIILSTLMFFFIALWIGPWFLRRATSLFEFCEPWEEKLIVSFLFVMILSWIATLANLSTIIGAFTAGVIIHDGYFRTGHAQRDGLRIRELLAPLEVLFTPLFFMLVGLQVKLETFFNWHVVLIASVLLCAAIVGKLVSGLGASAREDRLLIGIGMLPRGEVGLVFASIGRTLGIISDELFAAIVLMVIVTTFIAPTWLKSRYARKGVKHAH